MHNDMPFETKVDDPGSVSGLSVDQLAHELDSWRREADGRLAGLERKTADPPERTRLDRIAADLDRQRRVVEELAVRNARPPLGLPEEPGGGTSPAAREHKAAFEAYVRRGTDRSLAELEAKALSAGSQTDGGYLVPIETEAAVNRALRDLSPIRAIADVRQISTSVLQKPYAVSDFATGWVTETGARAQTGTPAMQMLSFPTLELYAMPAATQQLLDDSAVDIDGWIADEVRQAFARQEGQAFVSGDGVTRPKGFLSYPTVAAASWTWGSVGFLTTGVAGGFPATNPADKLIDLTFAVKAGYRANARFVMNRATLGAIRKFKDASGQYIWQPATRAGEPSTILGYPVTECEDMPGMAADAFAIAFGDFRRGYLVVDRVGIRTLRDPYSTKPYVLFYTTKRVGGGIQDFDAIKLLKFSA